MTLVANERTKLLANALDRASTACLTVGVLAPVAAATYQMGGAVLGVDLTLAVVGGVSWLIGAAMLHLFAQRALGRLK
jgi:hypothetical protein